VVRRALDPRRVRRIYDRAAGRYDLQHAALTLRSDERGRRLLVERTVRPGDTVLDAGTGTGRTALLAARRIGRGGRIALLDLSGRMLRAARARMRGTGMEARAVFVLADLLAPPFPAATFDVVLSTYSLCPVVEPGRAALALYRLVRPGGLLGVAHSTEPDRPAARRLARVVERIAWRVPAISLGCRAVSVLPALEAAGARLELRRRIGVPLWPFEILVVRKPAAPSPPPPGRPARLTPRGGLAPHLQPSS